MVLRKLLTATCAVVALLLAICGTVSAGVITWLPSTDLVAGGLNDSFVSTNGVQVLSFNGAGPAVTLNGQTFNQLAVGVPTTQNGVTLTNNAANANGPNTFAFGEFSGMNLTSIEQLIGGALWNGTQITLSGLTPGAVYEIQAIVNDARGGRGRSTNWEVGFTDGVGNTIAGIADLQNNPVGNQSLGQAAGDSIIGYFTADASGTQSFNYAGTRSGFTLGADLTNPNAGQSQINAFQLRQVPEPTSVLMFLGIGLTACVRRRSATQAS